MCLKRLPYMVKVAKNRTWAWVKYATTGAPKVRVGPLEQVWPPHFQDPGYATAPRYGYYGASEASVVFP